MGYDEKVDILIRLTDRASKKLDEIDRKFKELAKHGLIDSDVFVKMHGYEQTKKKQEELERDGLKKIYVKMLGDTPIDYAKLNEMRSRSVTERATMRGRSIWNRIPNTGVIGALKQDVSNDWSNARDKWSKAAIAKRRLGRAIDFVIPRYSQLLRIFSALVPVLIVLIAGALGVATAFAAVAIAGAAIVGLGLIGEGESIGQAFGNAQRRLSEFKRELFDVFQPTAQAFAPISERFLSRAPGELRRVARALREVTVFDDTIQDSFRGLTEWIAEGLVAMSAYEPLLSQVSAAFGKAIGETIIGFLGFVTEEAYNNQEMLMELGKTFATIMNTIYTFSLAFSKVVIAATPLFNLLEGIVELVSNEFGAAIAVAVGSLYLMISVFTSLQAALGITIGMLSTFHLLTGGILALTAAGVLGYATYSQVKGFRNGEPAGSPSRGGAVNIRVEGDMTDKNRREIESIFTNEYSSRRDRERYMSY